MNYLSEYQTFADKNELNNAVNDHLARHRYDLTDTDKLTLQTIARYAVKYAGVAHLKAATIAELIGKSEKTARRAVNKLAKLGIIRKVATMRKVSGGKGANILQILPVDQSNTSSRQNAKNSETATVERANSENEPTISFKQNNNLVNTYAQAPTFYAQFRKLITSTLGNVNKTLIYRLYGVYKGQSTPLLRTQYNDKATVELIGLQALKTAIFATKRKSIRNLAGYYNGVLNRLYDRMYADEMYVFGTNSEVYSG